MTLLPVAPANSCRLEMSLTPYGLLTYTLKWRHNFNRYIRANNKEIKNNAWVTVNNDFLGHEGGDLPMIFTSDEVTSENHRQIASRVTQKSLFTVTNVLFYFLHAILISRTHNSAKNHHRSLISQLSPRTVFSDFALWRHHSWSVTSREREILALWRHIRRLFLHAQIGAKLIFTSE